MQGQEIALGAAASEGVGSGVVPHIAAVAPEPAELDVVAMLAATLLEDKDELVLAAIERTHAGIVLGPNAEGFELAIDLGTSGQQFLEVAPVHADVVQ